MFSILRMTLLGSGDADALIIPDKIAVLIFSRINYDTIWITKFDQAWTVTWTLKLIFDCADINNINTWAEPHNANGVTPNTIIDSNDEPPANNQQRITTRNY